MFAADWRVSESASFSGDPKPVPDRHIRLGWTGRCDPDNSGGVSSVRWPRRPWRRFPFLEPQLGPGAILGAHGPLIGAAGVISISVFGSSELGFARASTYRGRPPGRDELEEVMSFNVIQESGRRLAFVDGMVPVDGQPVRARVAFLSAGERDEGDRWGVLLFGKDYSRQSVWTAG